MGKQLVLIGGGHAHMVTLAKLHTFVENGHRVTVVGPSDHHYYSGMGPGMLGKTYAPAEIRFATKHVVEKQGGTFIRDKATQVFDSLAAHAGKLGQLLAGLVWVPGEGFLRPHQTGRETGEYLERIVVQLAGKPGAFVLLGGHRAAE